MVYTLTHINKILLLLLTAMLLSCSSESMTTEEFVQRLMELRKEVAITDFDYGLDNYQERLALAEAFLKGKHAAANQFAAGVAYHDMAVVHLALGRWQSYLQYAIRGARLQAVLTRGLPPIPAKKFSTRLQGERATDELWSFFAGEQFKDPLASLRRVTEFINTIPYDDPLLMEHLRRAYNCRNRLANVMHCEELRRRPIAIGWAIDKDPFKKRLPEKDIRPGDFDEAIAKLWNRTLTEPVYLDSYGRPDYAVFFEKSWNRRDMRPWLEQVRGFYLHKTNIPPKVMAFIWITIADAYILECRGQTDKQPSPHALRVLYSDLAWAYLMAGHEDLYTYYYRWEAYTYQLTRAGQRVDFERMFPDKFPGSPGLPAVPEW